MNSINPEQRIQTICLLILSIIGVAFALHWLRPVMIPFVLALVLSFVLIPLIDLQIKHLKFPRFLAILTTFVIGFTVLFLVTMIFTASINQITDNLDSYQAKIDQVIYRVVNSVTIAEMGIDPKELVQPYTEDFSKNAGRLMLGTVNAIVGLLSNGILVIIFLMFLLIGRPAKIKPTTGVWSEIEPQIKKYIITKVIISSITGVLVGLILTFLNIDLALFFGFAAFILNFIPSVGSIIATALPIPVVMVSPDLTLTTGILAIALPGAIQFSIGNVVEPKIMGESLDLHPISILMALIFWGMIWGIVGMLLAAPLTAIMKIIFEKIEATAPLANLLAGRLND